MLRTGRQHRARSTVSASPPQTKTLARDGENGFTLSPEEKAELLLSIAEADRGETISAEEVLAKLARRRG